MLMRIATKKYRLLFSTNSRRSPGRVVKQVFSKMKPYAKANHFVGMSAITRKNSLGRNLLRMRKVSFAQRLIRHQYAQCILSRKNVFIFFQGRSLFECPISASSKYVAVSKHTFWMLPSRAESAAAPTWYQQHSISCQLFCDILCRTPGTISLDLVPPDLEHR